MGDYSDWVRRGRNFREGREPEYFEDTHDSSGNYVEPQNDEDMPKYSSRGGERPAQQRSPLPDKSQYIAPRFYQNVVVQEPRNVSDVQDLIDYLRRREPAIINLNNNEDRAMAQRILDYLSGAEYALGGTVHEIAENIYILAPEGVEITVPYEPYEI